MSRICKTTKNTKTGIQIFSESRRRERILANKKPLECLGFINAKTDDGGGLSDLGLPDALSKSRELRARDTSNDSDCDADDEEDKLRAVGRGSKVRVKALGKKRGKGKPTVRGVKGVYYYK